MRRFVACVCFLVAGASALAADPRDPCTERGTDLYLMNKCAEKRDAERRRDAERQRDRSRPGVPPQSTSPPVIVSPGPTPLQLQDARIGLRNAIYNDDVGSAMKFLPLGASEFLSPTDRGVTLLMVAAWRGHSVLVSRLADVGPRQTAGDVNGNHARMYAAAAGRLEVIQQLKGKLFPTACNAEGWTPLALAASRRDPLAVQTLLAQGDHPNGCGDTGVPPVVAALAAGDSVSVDALLRAGADPRLAGRFGRTAQQLLSQPAALEQVAQAAAAAVDRMRAEIDLAVWDKSRLPRPAQARAAASFVVPGISPAARELMAGRFAGSQSDQGLMEAVRAGAVAAVRTALERGADPGMRKPNDAPPLVLAARLPTPEVMNLLLASRAGAHRVTDDKTLLFEAMEAAALGRPENLRLLLALPGIDDTQGRLTALLRKTTNGDAYAASARLLLAAGANPGQLLDAVLINGGPELLRVFMNAGVDVKAPLKNMVSVGPRVESEQGFNALMKVAQGDAFDSPGMARVLIDAGFDVNARTAMGRSALWYAVERNKREMVKLLVQSGADVNVSDKDGRTPLHLVSASGPAEVLRLLIQAGADVNARSKIGSTPLMDAAYDTYADNVKKVQMLIDAGADVLAKNKDGIGIVGGSPEVRALIRRAQDQRQGVTPAAQQITMPSGAVPAQGQWTRIGVTIDGTVFSIDKASILRDGVTVKFWELVDMPQPMRVAGGVMIQSRKRQWEPAEPTKVIDAVMKAAC